MLDTTRAFETPEGIELQLHVAGPVVRAGAWLVDSLIRAALYLIVFMIFGVLGNIGTGLAMISVFLIEWFYPVFFEVLRGTTPGKKAFGLSVCHDNGTPIAWRTSILRNLLRVADFLPFGYGIGLICMLCNRDFKRLGDLAAGTLVIYRDDSDRIYRIPEQKPLALPQPLQLSEQRAILDFAERANSLSASRSAELAEILEPLTGQQGERGVKDLYRYANWLQKGGET